MHQTASTKRYNAHNQNCNREAHHIRPSRSPALQDRLPVYSNFFIECRLPAASNLHKPKSRHPCTNHDITHHRHPAVDNFFLLTLEMERLSDLFLHSWDGFRSTQICSSIAFFRQPVAGITQNPSMHAVTAALVFSYTRNRAVTESGESSQPCADRYVHTVLRHIGPYAHRV